MLPGDAQGPPDDRIRLKVASRTLLVDAAARRDLGLDHWPDGTVGRFLRDGTVVTVGPNGDGLARTEDRTARRGRGLAAWAGRRAGRRVSLRARPHGAAPAPTPVDRTARPDRSDDGPQGPVVPGLGVLTEVCGHVAGLREPADYAAGGPVLYDRRRDLALLVYHAEAHRSGEPRDFYSSLGLAVSHDGARTWTDLGRIVTAELPADDASRSWGPVEMGPGTLLHVDDRLVVLFTDVRRDGRRVNLAAASAPAAAVLDAAARGELVAWHKWDGTGFGQPGRGGRSAELLEPARTFGQVTWADAVWLPRRRRWVLVATTSFMGSWTLTVSASADGVRWGAPTVVEGSRNQAESLYVSAHEPLTRAERREVGPDGFVVLRVVSERGAYGRWDDAAVERLVLTPTD